MSTFPEKAQQRYEADSLSDYASKLPPISYYFRYKDKDRFLSQKKLWDDVAIAMRAFSDGSGKLPDQWSKGYREYVEIIRCKCTTLYDVLFSGWYEIKKAAKKQNKAIPDTPIKILQDIMLAQCEATCRNQDIDLKDHQIYLLAIKIEPPTYANLSRQKKATLANQTHGISKSGDCDWLFDFCIDALLHLQKPSKPLLSALEAFKKASNDFVMHTAKTCHPR
jgi:hypothetical protein